MQNRSSPPALSVQGVSHSYGSVNLAMPDVVLNAGQSCAVVGPSGCGKTSLLHLVAGLLTPQTGEVAVAGTRLDRLSQAARDRFRGRHVGMVLQQPRLLRALTLLDNLLLAQRLAGHALDRSVAEARLQALGLGHRLHHRPDQLSQGEAQRAAVARALLGRPCLILADEPTSSLDDANAHQVLHLLTEEAAACSAALLVVTHDQRVRGQLDLEIGMGAEPAP